MICANLKLYLSYFRNNFAANFDLGRVEVGLFPLQLPVPFTAAID